MCGLNLCKLYRYKLPGYINKLKDGDEFSCELLNTDNIKKNNNENKNIKKKDISKINQEIQTALNSYTNKYNKQYNNVTKIFNDQLKIKRLQKKELNIKNKILKQQSDDLSHIENNIINKSRLIELNENKVNKDNRLIKMLGGTFIFFLVLVIPIILFYSKIINFKILLVLIAIDFIALIIYYIIIASKFKIKKFIRPIKKDISKFEKAIEKNFNNEDKKMRGLLSDFVYGDCACDEEEEEENGGGNNIPNVPKGTSRFIINKNQGNFYYDGSSPPEQIYPVPRGSINVTNQLYLSMARMPINIPKNIDDLDASELEKQFLKILKRNMYNKGIPNNPRELRLIDWVSGANMGVSKSNNKKYNSYIDWTTKNRIPFANILPILEELGNNNKMSVRDLVYTIYFFVMQREITDIEFNESIITISNIMKKKNHKEAFIYYIDYLMSTESFKKKFGNKKNLFEWMTKKMVKYTTLNNNNRTFSNLGLEKI